MGKMRLLLDTHALLWWLTDDPQLSARARQAIKNPRNLVLARPVAAWELATKHPLGKVPGAERISPRLRP
jgi:PIN domain nuclease of toxin-antitoxin system